MKYGIQMLTIKALVRRNWLDTEIRVKINDAKVEQYASEKTDGDVFPRPIVFCDPKTQLFWVGDGFHRILADKRNGAKTVEVTVHRGKKIDAMLHCITANKMQRGLPLSTGDKVKAVESLLTAPECNDWTMTRIAEFVGCAVPTVTHVKNRLGIERPDVLTDKNGRQRRRQCVDKDREEVAARRVKVKNMLLNGMTQEAIADEIGVSRSAISRDVYELKRERDLCVCPNCNGSGYITNLKSA